MKFKILKSLIFTILIISTNIFAEQNMVAKVLILRGQAKAKLVNGNLIDIKVEQDIAEGTTLQTAEKSFVKLIFIDKSQMNLGPSSQMIINAFPKKEAGIITLVKGQLRSQVTKDYMEMNDKNKSKLYIKTNSAAMGIRGTDFQVNYNPENRNTSLITFEGAVAMSHFDRNSIELKYDQMKLEKVVSGEKAVMVTGGHISAVNLSIAERAMQPTKLAPSQIEALKENESGTKESTDKSSSKKFRDPIPPGTDGSAFVSNAGDTDKVKKPTTTNESTGFFNDKTGEYKLPAGSIIDLKTVNLIPPPANAIFDQNTKTYQVPDTFGNIDKSTGDYKAPAGLKLNNDGKFQIIDLDNFNRNQIKNEEKKETPKGADDKDLRTPASVGTQPNVGILPPGLNEIRPDMQNFVTKFAVVNTGDKNPGLNDQLKNLANEKILATEKVNQNNSNLGNVGPTSKVNIIFNAQ